MSDAELITVETSPEQQLVTTPDWQYLECVYFLHAVGTDLVKVGWSRDLLTRFRHLRTACPHKLNLLAIHPGSSDIESLYHRDLAIYRQEGEWFLLTAEVRRWLLMFLRNKYTKEWRGVSQAFPFMRIPSESCPWGGIDGTSSSNSYVLDVE